MLTALFAYFFFITKGIFLLIQKRTVSCFEVYDSNTFFFKLREIANVLKIVSKVVKNTVFFSCVLLSLISLHGYRYFFSHFASHTQNLTVKKLTVITTADKSENL